MNKIMPKIFKPDPVKKLIKPHGFDLILIIDRSGSMSGTEEFIIEHYDKMVKGLKELNKNITLTTILFDHEFVIAYDGVKLNSIAELDYYAGGSTALYDAWGAAIAHENERKNDKNNPFFYTARLRKRLTFFRNIILICKILRLLTKSLIFFQILTGGTMTLLRMPL